MIEEFEKIKEEIEQLRIKNEELNNRIREVIENGKKLTEEDKYKLPEPKDSQKYYTVITGEASGVRDYYYTSGYDFNNYEHYNCFLNEEDAEKRFKQVSNYFKVLHYLEAVNEGWKPDSDNINHVIVFEDCVKENYLFSYSPLKFKDEKAINSFRKYITDDEIKLFLNPLGVN